MSLEPVDYFLSTIFGPGMDLSPEFLPRFKRHVGKQQLIPLVEVVLQSITPRKRRALELHFGLNGHQQMTLRQIAQDFGLSTGERIRQIEAKSFRLIRHPSRSCKLKPFSPSNFAYRIACARGDLYLKLMKLYPKHLALTVALRVKVEDLRQAFRSTEMALKSSCGASISSCLYCQKPLPPGWNFCGVHCRARWKFVPLICDGCGKEFKRHASQLFHKKKDGQRTATRRVFCCRPCMWANWKLKRRTPAEKGEK